MAQKDHRFSQRLSILGNVGTWYCGCCKETGWVHLVINYSRVKKPDGVNIYFTTYGVCGICGNFSELSFELADSNEAKQGLSKLLGSFIATYRSNSGSSNTYAMLKDHLFHRKIYKRMIEKQTSQKCISCSNFLNKETLIKFTASPSESVRGQYQTKPTILNMWVCGVCGYSYQLNCILNSLPGIDILRNDKTLIEIPVISNSSTSKTMLEVLTGALWENSCPPKVVKEPTRKKETSKVTLVDVTVPNSVVEPNIMGFVV